MPFMLLHRRQADFQLKRSVRFMASVGRRIAEAVVVAASVFVLGYGATASATDFYWDPLGGTTLGGDGTWTTPTGNFWSTSPGGGSPTAWVNGAGNNAHLTGTAGTLTVTAAITAGTVFVDTTGYTLVGAGASTATLHVGTITLNSNVTLTFGPLVSTGNTPFSFSGQILGASGGTLNFQGAQAGGNIPQLIFSGASTVSVPITVTQSAGATATIDAAILSKTSAGVLINGATITNNTSSSGAIRFTGI